MSRLTTDITFDVLAQVLELRVQQGRPTSATFEVFNDWDNDDVTPEFSGTATVTSPSTTVDVASGPSQVDPQKLSLAATTGIVVGRKYLVSEGSKQEWVEPIEIVSADYIRCRHPLKNDYTTAATLVSTTITAAVDATWVVDQNNLSDLSDPNPDYRVRWVVVVSGVTYVAYSYFDLVRAAWQSEVDIDDLNGFAPGLKDSIPIEYTAEDGRPLIVAAERMLRADMVAALLNPDSLRDHEEADTLVILSALCVIAEGGWRPPNFTTGEYVALRRGIYSRHFEQHLKVALVHKLDTGTGGGAEVKPQPAQWAK